MYLYMRTSSGQGKKENRRKKERKKTKIRRPGFPCFVYLSTHAWLCSLLKLSTQPAKNTGIYAHLLNMIRKRQYLKRVITQSLSILITLSWLLFTITTSIFQLYALTTERQAAYRIRAVGNENSFIFFFENTWIKSVNTSWARLGHTFYHFLV